MPRCVSVRRLGKELSCYWQLLRIYSCLLLVLTVFSFWLLAGRGGRHCELCAVSWVYSSESLVLFFAGGFWGWRFCSKILLCGVLGLGSLGLSLI